MALPPHPFLEVKALGDVTVARVTARRLGESDAGCFGEELFRLADRLGPGELQLDLGELKYLTSMGLAKFVALHKRLRAAGGHLSLWNVGPALHEVLAVNRLTDLLDVRPKAGGATGPCRRRRNAPCRAAGAPPPRRRPRTPSDRAACRGPLDGLSSPAGPGS
jgi:anti-anti-sigma factor